MNLKSAFCGFLAVISALSCSETGEQPEPEVETSLSFEVKELRIPAGMDSEIELAVEPLDKALEVEFSVADEKVVSIGEQQIINKGVMLELKSNALGTTTLAAVLDDKMVSCNVMVVPVDIESITLDQTSVKLPVFATTTIGVKIGPDNATNPKVSWSSSDESVAVVSHGEVTALSAGTAVITASVGELKADCQVTVYNIDVTSLDLDVTSREISVGETFIVTATVLPEDATMKSVKWSMDTEDVISYEIIDAVEGDNIIAARVCGVRPGTVTLTAEASGLRTACNVVVKSADIPADAPKVGDYYYSDGTWSDGGLLSINEDGTDPVWRDVKPAPLDGKTVIGIVFQTDASRISDAEKAAGHTHGLVMAIRSAHSQADSLTMYSFESNFEKIPDTKTGVKWYADITGLDWTEKIKESYPGDKIQQCPAFDWTVTDFSPSAPTGTSGWYVPSIGQVWDLIANLGGGEAAAYLKVLRGYESDITYYYREVKMTLSYNPIAKINESMSMVPDSMKERLKVSAKRSSGYICELMSSSLYDNTDGNVCEFWLYDSGEIEATCDWTDQKYVCRPVLSF